MIFEANKKCTWNLGYSILGTIIILFSTIGSYSLQNNTGNVLLMMIAGVVGFAFSKFGFNNAALILGLVLGEMIESNLRRAIMIEEGNAAAVFTKPITAALLIFSMISLLWPFVKPYVLKNKAKK